MVDREAKKQRLRELRDQHEYVKTIVNHMGKYYKTTEPPLWLDMRFVAGQLNRSTRPHSSHAAWRYLKDSVSLIQRWMGGYESWEDAVKAGKMPHIGTPSEIKATEFIQGKEARVPKCIMQSLMRIKLHFLVDAHPLSEDKIPDLWRGARLDDPEWRSQFMEKSGYVHHVPFDDDLADLVLSTVCQRGQSEDKQQSPAQAGAEGDKHGPEPVEEEIPAKKVATKDGCAKGSGDADMWEHQVQATMSRIADTFNEALATERAKLLNKRCRQEDDAAPVQRKRQKTVEPPSPEKVMDTIERSEDDRSTESPTARACAAKEDEQLRRRKAAHKKLRKDHDELGFLCRKLDGSRKKLEEGIEHLTKQHKKLRNDHNAGEQKHQQLAEKCDGLEAQIKTLEVRCTALTDDVRKLEDKSGQTAAQCTAL
jgi:archaellum component FlaC